MNDRKWTIAGGVLLVTGGLLASAVHVEHALWVIVAGIMLAVFG